jgi:hypothetical protein
MSTKLLFSKGLVLDLCKGGMKAIVKEHDELKEKVVGELMGAERYRWVFIFRIKDKKWDRARAEREFDISADQSNEWVWERRRLNGLMMDWSKFHDWVNCSEGERIKLTVEDFGWLIGWKGEKDKRVFFGNVRD